MNQKITCPVCDRSAIEISVCPNCQTDLSLIRMLSELPPIESVESNHEWWKWSLGILISAILLLGWGLWVL
jgi:hypothetical protein